MRLVPLACLLAACGGSAPAARPAPAAAPAAPPAVAIRRSILSFGHRIGSSKVSLAADGTITNVVDIHDNGRGPHAEATLRLGADGTIAELAVTGHTEL